MSDDDFSARPLYAGTVLGVRAWNVRDRQWTEGENIAACGEFSLAETADWAVSSTRCCRLREAPPPDDMKRRALSHWYGPKPKRTLWWLWMAFWAICNAVLGVIPSANRWVDFSNWLAAIICAVCAVVTYQPRRRNAELSWPKIRRNYPNVPVYRSMKTALQKHPVEPPQLEDGKNDDD